MLKKSNRFSLLLPVRFAPQKRLSVAKEITEKSGIPVAILSGEEEANYIYLGVRDAMDLGPEPSLIIDIGGGSVEFIVGNNSESIWKGSFEIGGQRLLEQFHTIDPISPEQVENLYNHLELRLQPVLQALEKFKPAAMVGSSGTFDTLSEIYCIRHGSDYPA